jgi:hypothetical protein
MEKTTQTEGDKCNLPPLEEEAALETEAVCFDISFDLNVVSGGSAGESRGSGR